MSITSPVPPSKQAAVLKHVTEPDLATRTKVIAVLAIVSAIISAVTIKWEMLGPLTAVFGPIPALAFGAVIAFAMYQAGIRDKFHLAFVVLLTLGVWICAQHTGVNVFNFIDRIIKTPTQDGVGTDAWLVTNRGNFASFTAYFIGGLVGGLGMFVQTAFVAKPLRKVETCMKLAATGGICALVFCTLSTIIPFGSLESFVLFLVWQVPVAVILARSLGAPLVHDSSKSL